MTRRPFDFSVNFPRSIEQLIISANDVASKSMTEEVIKGSTSPQLELWVDFTGFLIRTSYCGLVWSKLIQHRGWHVIAKMLFYIRYFIRE